MIIILSKETFVNSLNKVRDNIDREARVSEVLYREGIGDVLLISCVDPVLDILEELFEHNDLNKGLIEYFCWEIDFGREYKQGCLTYQGEDVDISSAEKLYDFLILSDRLAVPVPEHRCTVTLDEG